MAATSSTLLAAESGMLIRKPVQEVFRAFIDPAVTTQFWFTKSTGQLEKGKTVTWTWEMYHVSTDVVVKEIVPNEKIEIEWGNGGTQSRVEWTFEPFNERWTFVRVINDGFKGDEAAVIAQVKDSTGGFCWVLAGLKAYLEHNIQLNLVGDRFPKGK